MAHTATSTVGKEADSAKSKNIFLFYVGQHTHSRHALRARHAHQTRESADLQPDKARGNVPNVRRMSFAKRAREGVNHPEKVARKISVGNKSPALAR